MELKKLILFINHIIDYAYKNEYKVDIQADDEYEDLTIHVSASRDPGMPTFHRLIHINYYKIFDSYRPDILAEEYMKKVSCSIEDMIERERLCKEFRRSELTERG